MNQMPQVTGVSSSTSVQLLKFSVMVQIYTGSASQSKYECRNSRVCSLAFSVDPFMIYRLEFFKLLENYTIFFFIFLQDIFMTITKFPKITQHSKSDILNKFLLFSFYLSSKLNKKILNMVKIFLVLFL